ncbi:hypothetical protein GV827_15370 [Sulfitobacter sp. JBTF-M27]|uniref:Calcium-binding protein n=1 Tax=Sulfitobacter sediminilitoris TaxID=2698830 RepID=A0A6P0CD25_9RHOB|nr:calcium-binding protein [Sulfitobacter sediminilitoris]NEK23777.1 hypothetical protein [Sulfitobacter sediminilitoris]
MGTEAALFGMLGISFLFNLFSGSAEHDEYSEGDSLEVERTSDQLVAVMGTDVEGQTEDAEVSDVVSDHLGNNETTDGRSGNDIGGNEGNAALTGSEEDESNTIVMGNSTANPGADITDYNASEDQLLVEYDVAVFPDPDVTVETVTDDAGTYSTISLNAQEIGRVVINEGSPALSSAEIGLVPITISLTDNDDYHLGTSAAEHIIGGRGDDTIVGNGGADRLAGWGGDDELISHGNGGRLSGNQGDDYLEARKTSYGQYHLYGGDGEDTFVMHLDNNPGWGHQGFHAYGGDQSDEFRFVGVGTTNAPMMARIEDFDASLDSIWVDDEEIDLNALPADMRIVNYHDQQWLVIEENIMIGLEGARTPAPSGVPTMMGGAEEMHFHAFPANLANLPAVQFNN